MLVQIFVKNKKSLLVLLLTSILSFSAFAQEEEAEEEQSSTNSVPAGKGQTVYMEFGNELIDGKVANPSVEYIFNRSQFNYKRLIRLRENFQSEVKQGRGDFSGSR